MTDFQFGCKRKNGYVVIDRSFLNNYFKKTPIDVNNEVKNDVNEVKNEVGIWYKEDTLDDSTLSCKEKEKDCVFPQERNVKEIHNKIIHNKEKDNTETPCYLIEKEILTDTDLENKNGSISITDDLDDILWDKFLQLEELSLCTDWFNNLRYNHILDFLFSYSK